MLLSAVKKPRCSGSGTASGHGTATVTIDFVFTGATGLLTGAWGSYG
jgi:hypothetical protein